ncbi:transmembrane protein 180-like [Mercenaria mercenaria]|uniref:transmembrane protein 180-like n=1 Tax=Mercenaria mercenaria TaxID=6596 RepID=UPI00234F7118|nr:transmembrane protein 180-like [Mercenaria mercenaria]XP_045191820.2 transmembrane protein 180-like [Mercenaria mercenaria]
MTSRTSLQTRILAVAALSMGCSLIGSAFGFYYVKVFLNYYHIEENWFQLSQTLFLIWNAINDPLFAYFQDSTNFRCSRTRRESVLYAAPFFALSFLVPWFPWGNPETLQPWVTGIHLITALCFWDTMFTYVGLAACCLFTEMTKDNTERLKMIKYNQIGCLMGSSSVFLLQYMSNQLENFQAFQATCVAVAVVSCLLMMYCGKHAHTERELQHESDVQCGKPKVMKSQEHSYFTLTKQLLFNRDFISFVITNFFQEFHRTFLSNFFAIFADQLIVKGAIPPLVRSLFYGASSTGAKLIVIFGTGIVSRFGYYKVIRYSQIFMIAYGLIYYMTGPINHWCLMFFMLLNSFLADSIFSLFNLPLSDIADNDMARYNRRHPVTSMVYGINALVVKPAISLSPMLVVSILNSYGYDRLKDGKLDAVEETGLSGAMFSVLCLYPFVIGCIQFCSWSFYTIRGTKSAEITCHVLKSTSECST